MGILLLKLSLNGNDNYYFLMAEELKVLNYCTYYLRANILESITLKLFIGGNTYYGSSENFDDCWGLC